jgi:hypothetical protein
MNMNSLCDLMTSHDVFLANPAVRRVELDIDGDGVESLRREPGLNVHLRE